MKNNYSSHQPVRVAKVSVVSRAVVTEENLEEILGVTATEQHPMIRLGDTISVVFFTIRR